MSEVEAPVQTLDELIKRGIQNAIQSQAILEAVQKHAEKAVSEAVRSAFDYGSEFRKGIESAIREVLPVIKAEELAQFSVAVREVIQRRLGNLANATAKQHLDEMLQKILPESAEITLEELEQQFKAKVKDSRREPGCHCDDDDEESLEYTWNIDNSQSSVCDGYWDLTAGMSPDIPAKT
jgi:histone H3/H4